MAIEALEAVTGAEPTSSALRQAWASLAAVFRNRSLRRMQLALAGSMVGDWAYATAVTVWAYDVGGTKAVGLWGAIRLGLMAVVAPLAAAMVDRFPRKTVMVSIDLARVVVVAVAAACVHAETSPWPVFVLATVASLLGSVFRPAQMALVPSVANDPQELAASNGASSTIESLAFFLGPALGALLVARFEVALVFLVNCGSFLLSALLVLGIRLAPDATEPPDREGAVEPDADEGLAGVLAGFTTIWRNRDLLTITFLTTIQTLVAGASLVFTVVLAIDILHTGAEGVGYIDSVFGVGAIAGGFFAIVRGHRRTLAADLALGVLLWSVPLLLIAAWESPLGLFATVTLMGFGNPLVDVNYATLTQRLAPDEVLGRVFGAGEGALVATMALGAALTPFLLSGLGLRSTLLVLGLVVSIPALLLLPRCRNLDGRLVAPEGLDLLSAIPMFRPLGVVRIESLAQQLERVEVPAGTVVIREGDVSDRFYVIASGEVEVSIGDRVVGREAVGDFFGEIGLLRDVPRTASVTAVGATTLLALHRGDFLDAVTGEDEATRAAEDIVARRMLV